jgi:hypothetical protein
MRSIISAFSFQCISLFHLFFIHHNLSFDDLCLKGDYDLRIVLRLSLCDLYPYVHIHGTMPFSYGMN